MRTWRFPLLLSVLVLLAQLFHQSAVVDVVTGAAPAGAALSWPVTHVLLAPLTLVADWLNGGSTGDLIGFAAWSVVLFVLWRLFAAGPRRLGSEAWRVLLFLAGFGAFIWWGARWSRPVPRLVAADSSLIIFDIHSHTSASHDGRPGFGIAANAAWHQRTGFDAAFITDHNVYGSARQWQLDRAGRPPRLLNGEELSLNGLHIVVLGNDSLIRNAPWNSSFDSSLALLAAIHSGEGSTRPLIVASLPEYSRYHWGADLGRLVESGVEGFEIWTTSPKAMDFPPARRDEVIARARSLGLVMSGSTDMHGLGYAATVWNVAALPGWRGMSDSALTRALLARLRAAPADGHVVARRRWLAPTKNAQMVGVPVSLATVLRSASRPHAVMLLVWIWVAVLVARRRNQPGQAPAETVSSAGSNAPRTST